MTQPLDWLGQWRCHDSDRASATRAHIDLAQDATRWARCAQVGLETDGASLFEKRLCVDCGETLHVTVTLGEALRGHAERLEVARNSAEVLAIFCADETPTEDDASLAEPLGGVGHA